MSSPETDRPEDNGPDVTAGEYVLGVLGPAEHAAAARRTAEDPAFAAEVADWEKRLTPLIAHFASVAPPAGLWPAIAQRLRGTVVPLPARPSYWNSLAVWRAVSGASAALAAACLVVALLPRTPPPAPAAPVSIARLDAPDGGGAAFIATFDEAKHQLIVTPTGRPTPAGRSPELWLMPPKATPVSLGVFMGQASLVVPAPAGLAAGSQLGVSLEPLGGSPSGAPTGPVIAAGHLTRL